MDLDFFCKDWCADALLFILSIALFPVAILRRDFSSYRLSALSSVF
jgi:hypothetical protein